MSGEGAVWVVLQVAWRERCGRAWGCVGVWAVSAVFGAVWVCGGCGWWAVSVVSEGGGGGGGGWRVWSCWGSKRALSSGGDEGMWAVGGHGGGGVARGVGGDYKPLDSLSLEERKACGRWGRWVCWRTGRHVGGGCGGIVVVGGERSEGAESNRTRRSPS